MTPVRIAEIRAERCHFNLCCVFNHENDAETRAYINARREELLHALRMGVSRNIIICGLAPKLQIAHAASDQVSLMARSGQRAPDMPGQVARTHYLNYAPGEERRRTI